MFNPEPLQDLNSNFEIVSDNFIHNINLEKIKSFKLESDDLISVFIQTIVKLKTDINYNYVKKACEAENIEFEKDMVKIGKYEIHAYTYTVALTQFIRFYREKYNSKIKDFVDANLLRKKDELFFFDFKVELGKNDFKSAEGIIDALCVKFYQELTLILNNFFSLEHKVLIITPVPEKNIYRFEVRNMTIEEIDLVRQGKSIINAKK